MRETLRIELKKRIQRWHINADDVDISATGRLGHGRTCVGRDATKAPGIRTTPQKYSNNKLLDKKCFFFYSRLHWKMLLHNLDQNWHNDKKYIQP